MYRRVTYTCIYSQYGCTYNQIMTAVSDTERLGANLLPIAGRRMMAYLSRTPNLLEEISRINPALTRYLESLVRVPAVALAESIFRLSDRAILFPERA